MPRRSIKEFVYMSVVLLRVIARCPAILGVWEDGISFSSLIRDWLLQKRGTRSI